MFIETVPHSLIMSALICFNPSEGLVFIETLEIELEENEILLFQSLRGISVY